MDDVFEFQPSQVVNIQLELLIKMLALQKALATVLPEFVCKTDEEKDEFISLLNEQHDVAAKSILHDLYERKGKEITVNDILRKPKQ